MAAPQTYKGTNSPGTPAYGPAPFVKVFASPGIDSTPNEQGVFSSGAGLRPDTPTFKVNPWDWGNDAPSQGNDTEHLVGGVAATKAPNAKSMAIRRRGVSPWGGSALTMHPHAQQHAGGIQDLNPGADYKISGGKGQASSFCRVEQKRDFKAVNAGMKLPVLAQEITRGGAAPIPTGGTFDGSPAAPVMPRITGWPTIFSFRGAAKQAG